MNASRIKGDNGLHEYSEDVYIKEYLERKTGRTALSIASIALTAAMIFQYGDYDFHLCGINANLSVQRGIIMLLFLPM